MSVPRLGECAYPYAQTDLCLHIGFGLSSQPDYLPRMSGEVPCHDLVRLSERRLCAGQTEFATRKRRTACSDDPAAGSSPGPTGLGCRVVHANRSTFSCDLSRPGRARNHQRQAASSAGALATCSRRGSLSECSGQNCNNKGTGATTGSVDDHGGGSVTCPLPRIAGRRWQHPAAVLVGGMRINGIRYRRADWGHPFDVDGRLLLRRALSYRTQRVRQDKPGSSLLAVRSDRGGDPRSTTTAPLSLALLLSVSLAILSVSDRRAGWPDSFIPGHELVPQAETNDAVILCSTRPVACPTAGGPQRPPTDSALLHRPAYCTDPICRRCLASPLSRLSARRRNCARQSSREEFAGRSTNQSAASILKGPLSPLPATFLPGRAGTSAKTALSHILGLHFLKTV